MENFLIVVDPQSPMPAYEQIRAQLSALIAARRLAPDAELPSVRQLARDLAIAPNTVVRAYGELERTGWIVSSFRRGFRVAATAPALAATERDDRLRAAISQLLVTTQQLGVTVTEVKAEIDRQAESQSAVVNSRDEHSSDA